MLLKPRFGKRMCSGICPPSKPLMLTPERAFAPFCPRPAVLPLPEPMPRPTRMRSEEHTSELQSLMRISYAVFCLKKKNNKLHTNEPVNYTQQYNTYICIHNHETT